MFETYNPYVNLFYFILLIGISAFYINPMIIMITFISVSSYFILKNGLEEYLKFIKNYLFVMALIVLLNFLINHQGNNVLIYINNNPCTMESLLYGIFSSIMLFNILIEFYIFNKIMDSEKIYTILGKLSPTLSLILSFVLRFIPIYKTKFNEIKEVNLSLLKNGFIGKISYYSTCISSFVSYVLENGVDMADSFISRGYGVSKRTHFTPIKFKRNDSILLFIEVIFALAIIYFINKGIYIFYFFPTITTLNFYIINTFAYAIYFIGISIPILIDLKEELLWHIYKQRI